MGEKVTVLAGVNITREPDKVPVTRPIPYLSLKRGDTILRYDTLCEGASKILAKGVWYKDYDSGRTAEKDGRGCGAANECDAVVIENGIQEWWVEVKTSSGLTGWVTAFKSSRLKF